MAKNDVHVVPNDKGGWSVRATGASRATRTFSTQSDALAYGKSRAKQESSGVYLHASDGSIRETVHYKTGDTIVLRGTGTIPSKRGEIVRHRSGDGGWQGQAKMRRAKK